MVTQYLAHGNGTIAYDERGTGPLIVCVPAMGDLRAEYRFLAPFLAEAGFRVVTMDVRGHGETSAAWPDYSVAAIGADIIALVQHLNAGPAIIIGTSMAAGAAVWAAAEAPEAIAGLVLVGPFVRDVMPVWQVKLLFTPLFMRPWGPLVWDKFYPTLYPNRKPSDFSQYLATLGRNVREPGRMKALRSMMTASKRAAEERLAHVTAPVVVVMGTRDPDFKDPVAEARLVAERLNGMVQLVDGAGHHPHAEIPDQTAAIILAFAHTVQQGVVHVA